MNAILTSKDVSAAADEMRRLQDVNIELLKALKSVRKTLLEAGGDPMPTLDAIIARAEQP